MSTCGCPSVHVNCKGISDPDAPAHRAARPPSMSATRLTPHRRMARSSSLRRTWPPAAWSTCWRPSRQPGWTCAGHPTSVHRSSPCLQQRTLGWRARMPAPASRRGPAIRAAFVEHHDPGLQAERLTGRAAAARTAAFVYDSRTSGRFSADEAAGASAHRPLLHPRRRPSPVLRRRRRSSPPKSASTSRTPRLDWRAAARRTGRRVTAHPPAPHCCAPLIGHWTNTEQLES